MNKRAALKLFFTSPTVLSIYNLANSFDILAASAGLVEPPVISRIFELRYWSTAIYGWGRISLVIENGTFSGFNVSPFLSFSFMLAISFWRIGLIFTRVISVSYPYAILVRFGVSKGFVGTLRLLIMADRALDCSI